jgi:hypothetical protein
MPQQQILELKHIMATTWDIMVFLSAEKKLLKLLEN